MPRGAAAAPDAASHAATHAAAALLQPLLASALTRLLPHAPAELAARHREALRPTRAPLGEADLACHAPVGAWRWAQAADRACAFPDAAALARALLAAAAGDALHATVAAARVAEDGTLLFTTRAAAAAAAAAGVLRCAVCGRAFAGTRALRNHAQTAHAADYGEAVSVVAAAAAAALALQRAAAPPPPPPPPLHPGLAAARDGDVASLRRLQAAGWHAATCVDRHGANALHWAAGGGHVDACRFLVEHAGLATSARQPKDGRQAIHWAARHGRLAVLTWLVDVAGADAAAATSDGTSAACWALWQGHIEACELLEQRCHVSNSASAAELWRAPNAYGCTAAHWAALRDENAGGVCEWLSGRGGAWGSRNAAGHTPLHKASARGHVTMLTWLLRHGGADVAAQRDAPDADGNTPLALAALWGAVKAVTTLLQHGADVEARGEGGATPLAWALFMGHADVAAALRAAGADEAAARACGLGERRASDDAAAEHTAAETEELGGGGGH